MRDETSKILIELETPTKHFSPGDTIAGRAVMLVHKPYEVREINVIFEGSGTVTWSDGDVNYASDESYLQHKILLLGNEPDDESTLHPGTHFYPFEYTLPENLPSSYEITGDIEGTIDYFIEVTGTLDLNTEMDFFNPLVIRNYKSQGFLCCKSGLVGFSIEIPRRGFVPGELVNFNGEVMNRSRRRINMILVKLFQTVTVKSADENAKSISKVICETKGSKMERGASMVWGDKSGFVIRIPEVPPTHIGSCKIIDLEYALQFELDITGLAASVKTLVPIIIGTVPFRTIK